ncbi:MAG TPA: SDR family oxidoreductase [Acidimicrobiales bacterium]|nr:SDR family oxidoreductase [Acidimicrobiales bacterium]
MDLGLAGAAVAVTGGTKGMGRAAAECFAADGARVAVLARGAAALDETAAALAALGSPDVAVVAVDVTDRAAVEGAFGEIRSRWGELNALVNTVGPGAGRLDELSDEQWEQTFALGTMAAVHCVRAALPLLRAAGWARVVNVSAHSIQRQSPMLVAYTASKAALTSISKNLARSLAPEGILVNTVSPGTIVTASFTENLKAVLDELGLDASDPHDVMRWIADTFHQPADLGRAGIPDEVGAVIAFLASRRNGYVTGANVNVDGGSDFV